MRGVKRVSIRTSYFANYKRDNGVSIAQFTPRWFKGEEYKELAPPKDLLLRYKNKECSREDFRREFTKELDKLDPNKVHEDLKGKVLLCYEVPSDFCHRHIVAKWLKDKLGIKVVEI